MKDNQSVFSTTGISLPEIIHRIGDCIAVCDSNFKFAAANQNIANWYGLTPEELVGKTVFDVYPTFESSVFFDGAFSTVAAGKSSMRLGFSQNTKQWLMVRTFKLEDGRSVWAAQSIDTDTLSIGRCSEFDNLTSLKNRISFDTDVREVYSQGAEFGIAIIDVIELPQLKDFRGARVSDRCLLEVTARLRGASAIFNQIYMIGNGQFGLIIPKNRQECIFELHRIHSALKHPFYYSGKPESIETSIGFMFVDNFAHKPSYILEEAQFAIERAMHPLSSGMYHEHILTFAL